MDPEGFPESSAAKDEVKVIENIEEAMILTLESNGMFYPWWEFYKITKDQGRQMLEEGCVLMTNGQLMDQHGVFFGEGFGQ